MLKNRRILVVEDEVLIGMELAASLREHGAIVIGPASSLARAFEVLSDQSAQFDAALLDVNLGKEMIFPFADALAERNIPFAFLTAYRSSELPEHLRDAPIFQKPIDFMALGKMLQFEAR